MLGESVDHLGETHDLAGEEVSVTPRSESRFDGCDGFERPVFADVFQNTNLVGSEFFRVGHFIL